MTMTDLSAANAPSRTWTYQYTYHDAAKRQVATITVDGPRTDTSDQEVFQLNAEGRLTSYTNSLGHETVYASRAAATGN